MSISKVLLSIIWGFLPGSIPFGFLTGKLAGVDVREKGSGNIGFTNIQRTIGIGWAIPVLFFDIAKGLLPTVFASELGLTPVLVGLSAIAGHIFTPWLGFKGGKGVATTIGVTAYLCPRSLLICLLLFLLILLVFGYVSLASLSFAFSLPLVTQLCYPKNLSLFLFALAIGAIIFIRHLSNIRRLIKSTEPKFGLWLRLFKKRKAI
ncbi:MAG: glycerol-3-phosphate 1-O-acyltransferase PlsY [bacterium]